MRFDFGGFNWKKFGALTQREFLKVMRSEGYTHILKNDTEREEKLKQAHRLMKARYKIEVATTVKPD